MTKQRSTLTDLSFSIHSTNTSPNINFFTHSGHVIHSALRSTLSVEDGKETSASKDLGLYADGSVLLSNFRASASEKSRTDHDCTLYRAALSVGTRKAPRGGDGIKITAQR